MSSDTNHMLSANLKVNSLKSEYFYSARVEYHIRTTLNGFYHLTEIIHSEPPVVTSYDVPYLASLSSYTSGTGKPLSAEVITQSILNGYKFPTDTPVPIPPRVAFTLKSSSVKGGGPLMVYRYAEWLSRLGIAVAIYSDDVSPEWLQLSAAFYHYTYEVDRYAAIAEPIVIVYSVMELPAFLKYCATDGKRIYHLCQGIENFHYVPPQEKELTTAVPIFDLLNALPIPRIAVSRHIERFLQQRYGHMPFTIINGIDLEMFYPASRGHDDSRVLVLTFGNPEIPLKGVAAALVALVQAHAAFPEREFHLDVVCGEDVSGRFESEFSQQGVTCSIHYCLEPEQIRNMFHAADLYINASYYEGFGLPSLEAMACGIPVVQVDNHGLAGIVTDGENCVIAPSQDSRDIAAAVLRVVSDDELRTRIVRNGIATAARFSVRNQFAEFVEQFQRILGITFEEKRIKEIMDRPLSCSRTMPDPGELELTGWGRPMFTVLIPTYNQAQYLPACLESLLAQTCPNWEAVIVNDGSTDTTREVLDRYASKDERLRVFHKENGGVATALNLALEHARGKWICWLSSDDMFMPDKLETQVQAFAANPGIYFFHTNYNVFYEETGRLSAIELPEDFVPQENLQVLKFFEINYFNGVSIAVHRSVFERVGAFNTSLRNGQDYDMWLRISALYRSRYINVRTCVTRVHPEQGSSISSDAGIFDSARASLDFLKHHRFEELFPLLDLTRPDHGLLAIQAVLKILINPLAYVNCCGFGRALLGRMREWLGNPAQRHHIGFLSGHQFSAIVAGIVASDLPDDLKIAFQEFQRCLGASFIFHSPDALQLLEQHACFLESLAGRADDARSLRQYLARYGKVARSELAEKSNVSYWQKIQEQGYFENHPCYGREHSGLVLFGNDDQTIRDYTPLTSDMNVVVIGCGYGRESTLIAPHVKHVYGIDVSDLILDKARAFTASHGIDNFTAVHAELWQQEIPDGIDLVYTMVVFQHLTRDLVKAYISGLADKLTRNGRMLCQFCESRYGTHDAALTVHEPNVNWTTDEIRELLSECGLQLYRLDSGQVAEESAWHWAFFGH